VDAPGPRLGVHLQLGAGLVRAAARATEIGADAIQVFADNPAAWRRRAAPPKRLPEFREQLAAGGVAPVAIHASYLVNLAGPDQPFRRQSIEVLASELRAAPGFGASLVNVHTGSHRETTIEDGIRQVVDGVAAVLASVENGPEAAKLVLENASGGGWSIGTTVEELAAIAEGAAQRGIPDERVGFCLDIAHAWGAGYDIATPEGVDDLVGLIDRELGLERLAMVHFNDSRSELGSRHDRHEHIGGGRIGEHGLRSLLTHPGLAGRPFILETPGMDEGYDRINLVRARALLAGETLEPLPPEAFTLRRGRASAAAPRDDGE
jgi:deoxyribonuclease-4